MVFLNVDDVLMLHADVIAQSGGSSGIRDRNGLESAVAQPQMTFGGSDLYPTLAEKAAAMGFSLIANHPFVDGNKRIGHKAMETFLVLNGQELDAGVDEQESVVLAVAAGDMKREEWTAWVQSHLKPFAFDTST
jgi:death-on-curing protein